jgi:hypothetical protein
MPSIHRDAGLWQYHHAMPDTPPEKESAGQRAIRALVARVPGADRVLAEHLADNEDELLPYVLINDLARFYVQAVADGDDDVGRALAEALEPMSTHPEIGVSGLVHEFTDGLFAHSDAGERHLAAVAALRSFAPPATAVKVARTLRWYGRADDSRPVPGHR